jgi:hypothetical protein
MGGEVEKVWLSLTLCFGYNKSQIKGVSRYFFFMNFGTVAILMYLYSKKFPKMQKNCQTFEIIKLKIIIF